MTMTPDQCFDEMAVALGLPKDTGYIDILAVVKKLKEENEKLKHNEYCLRQDAKGYSPSEVQEYREETEELKEENKKLKDTILRWQEKADFNLSDSDDEPPNCCEGCGEKFDLQYTMNHADKELREKYDKYFGSEEDDGDLCQICLDSNY